MRGAEEELLVSTKLPKITFWVRNEKAIYFGTKGKEKHVRQATERERERERSRERKAVFGVKKVMY